MQFLTFIIGIVVGLLIRDIKLKTIETIDKYDIKLSTKSQFVEPFTNKEKWDESKNISDLIDKL